MSISYLRRMFDHHYWADERVVTLLENDPPARGEQQAVRLFSHVLAAERVWLLRLRGESTAGLAVWPVLSPEELRDRATENRAGYERLLAGLDDARLAATLAYANQSGVEFRTPVGDILTHVALHGAYHRGQVAAVVRAGGAVPVNTDYITYVRENDPRPVSSPSAPPA